MAEDDTDREDAYEAEREAEIEEELERIGRDPEEVDAGGDLGRQNAPRDEESEGEDLEDFEERPDEEGEEGEDETSADDESE